MTRSLRITSKPINSDELLALVRDCWSLKTRLRPRGGLRDGIGALTSTTSPVVASASVLVSGRSDRPVRDDE